MAALLVQRQFRHRDLIEHNRNGRLRDYQIVYFDTCREIKQFIIEGDENSVFLLDDFTGEVYEQLVKKSPQLTLLGPPVFKDLLMDKENECLFYPRKHIYAHSLKNINFVQGGTPTDEARRLKRHINALGGCQRANVDDKTHFLVTTNLKSSKYMSATGVYDIPVLTRQALYDAWERRNDQHFRFDQRQFYEQYVYKCFCKTKVAFYGFAKGEDEYNQMVQALLDNDGELIEPSATADYIVVPMGLETPRENEDVLDKMVLHEWFWSCIEVNYRINAEPFTPEYAKRLPGENIDETNMISFQSAPALSPLHNSSLSKGNNKKRTKEEKQWTRVNTLFSLAKHLGVTEEEIEQDARRNESNGSKKPKSSLSDNGPPKPKQDVSKHVASELFTIEGNYVKSLEFLTTEYKKPLEDKGIISHTECKQIFGNLDDLLLLHRKVEAEMSAIVNQWSSTSQMGAFIMTHFDQFELVYPPYINYLDNAQKMIKELEGSNQRFNAFCRARLAKGSYNRQSLSALLSLPFQQLPRYILLLDSLLKSIKKFNEHHDDIPNLQNAIAGIKKVTATVNDKKQQADDHLAMFDIFSQIENAPNQIISAQRHYQFRFNCTAVDSSNKLGIAKGTKLCMLVFSDLVLVCKRKSKAKGFQRTPTRAASNTGKQPGGRQKDEGLSYRFIIQSSELGMILNVLESDECARCMAICVKREFLCTLSVQLTLNEKKDDVIRRLAEMVTKAQLQDNEFLDNLVKTVKHGDLNVTTKELSAKQGWLPSSARKLAKKISRINLNETSNLKSIDSLATHNEESPVLTLEQRYDSEASLVSIGSTMSVMEQPHSVAVLGNITQTPSRTRPRPNNVPTSPSLGFQSMRSLWGGKKGPGKRNLMKTTTDSNISQEPRSLDNKKQNMTITNIKMGERSHMTYRQQRKLAGAGTAGDQTTRRVRSILNKLTPENFGKLTEEFLDCDLGQLKRLKLVVDLIFEKAVDESKYCRLYALLCRRLNEEAPNYEEGGAAAKNTTFQKCLMNKLQAEFNQRRQGNVEPGSREKRQLLGLSTFIGELYSLSIFGEASVHLCLKTLLTGKDPEALECLVRIMETSGEKLDHAQAKNYMDQYFMRIKKLSENDQLPSRVRFRLLDIIDMRQREWRQRRQVAGPRPVSEIRAEFGSDLDPSLMSLSGLNMSPVTEEKPKTPKPSQCDFFAPRPAASTTPPIGGGVGAGGVGTTTATIESGESGGSLSRITKAFVGSVERTAKNGEKYQPPRRSAAPPPSMGGYQDHHSSPVKKEKSAEAKKAFMPAFIKPTNQAGPGHQPTNGVARFTALGKPGHIQSRPGLPGQSGMPQAPSPFDRINKDRQMHQNKTRQNHQRRESPTHSPSRDFGSKGRNYENGYSSGGSDNHRLSPHRRSPSFDNNPRNGGYHNGNSRSHQFNHHHHHTGNGFGGRHSPTTTRSPLARAESPRSTPTQILHRQPVQKLHQPEIDPNKELTPSEAVEYGSKLIKRYMDSDSPKAKIDQLNDVNMPDPAKKALLLHVFHKATLDRGDDGKWAEIIKAWSKADLMVEIVTQWLDGYTDESGVDNGAGIAFVIKCIIVTGKMDPHELESMFTRGRFHPVFFIILKELYENKGPVFIQKHFSDLDLLGMMSIRDRAELRQILAKHKLLFLRPWYREEQMIEEDKDLEAKEIYKSIKERCKKDAIAFGLSAGAMINLMWEKRIESQKCKPILRKMLDRKTQLIDAQLECVRTVVNAHIERGLPKGALIKEFHDLYDEELIHEESFLKWESDIHDQTPARQQALDNVERFLVWLKSAEEESDGDENPREVVNGQINNAATTATTTNTTTTTTTSHHPAIEA